MRISVIGTGYLGAVHAACMAELGHDVVGLDVDEAKVALLAAGKPSFHEPGFPELLARHVASGKLRFTTDPRQIADAEIHFIGVGTPQIPGRLGADMTYVNQAVDTLLEHAKPTGGPALVAGKSTVPVGTAEGYRDAAGSFRQEHHPGVEPRVPARGVCR